MQSFYHVCLEEFEKWWRDRLYGSTADLLISYYRLYLSFRGKFSRFSGDHDWQANHAFAAHDSPANQHMIMKICSNKRSSREKY